MTARLPRPWRRRRPTTGPTPVRPDAVTAPAADLEAPAAPYGARCALTHPDRRPVHRVVASYQDAHPGVVDRGMVAIPAGQHRAPEDPVVVQFVGDDDYPTVPIRLDAADTVAWPRQLLTAFAPAPAPAGAR